MLTDDDYFGSLELLLQNFTLLDPGVVNLHHAVKVVQSGGQIRPILLRDQTYHLVPPLKLVLGQKATPAGEVNHINTVAS